ncbi:hypothetical protein ACIRD8_26385 [Streptomyces sp. NPDC102451]|uniref:hypothetical protein n=1 Tax=Streptomyces sp. NPDC102451 TaxID=3366177 RepID=UPI003803FDBB
MAHQDDRLHGTRTVPARDHGTVPAPGSAAALPGDPETAPRPVARPRTTAAWVWMVVGLGGLMTGIVVGHGLLIAAGLVAAGVGGQLFDPDQRRRRRRPGRRAAL